MGQISYDSFGNHPASSRTRYTYTGRERDSDTGLMYYRARFYDPQTGRFANVYAGIGVRLCDFCDSHFVRGVGKAPMTKNRKNRKA